MLSVLEFLGYRYWCCTNITIGSEHDAFACDAVSSLLYALYGSNDGNDVLRGTVGLCVDLGGGDGAALFDEGGLGG